MRVLTDLKRGTVAQFPDGRELALGPTGGPLCQRVIMLRMGNRELVDDVETPADLLLLLAQLARVESNYQRRLRNAWLNLRNRANRPDVTMADLYLRACIEVARAERPRTRRPKPAPQPSAPEREADDLTLGEFVAQVDAKDSLDAELARLWRAIAKAPDAELPKILEAVRALRAELLPDLGSPPGDG